MKQAGKHYTPQEKVAILRRHLLEKVPVSDLRAELGLNPSVFYHWLKASFEHGAAAFQRGGRRNHQQEGHQRRMATLEHKLKVNNEGLAELIEEHMALKESFGETGRADRFPTRPATQWRVSSAAGTSTPKSPPGA